MLQTLGLLLGCQLAGEFVARGLGLPIPGPVLGLVILLAALALKPSLTRALRPTTQVILAHLSLMFVPAGVEVIGNLEFCRRIGPDCWWFSPYPQFCRCL